MDRTPLFGSLVRLANRMRRARARGISLEQLEEALRTKRRTNVHRRNKPRLQQTMGVQGGLPWAVVLLYRARQRKGP